MTGEVVTITEPCINAAVGLSDRLDSGTSIADRELCHTSHIGEASISDECGLSPSTPQHESGRFTRDILGSVSPGEKKSTDSPPSSTACCNSSATSGEKLPVPESTTSGEYEEGHMASLKDNTHFSPSFSSQVPSTESSSVADIVERKKAVSVVAIDRNRCSQATMPSAASDSATNILYVAPAAVSRPQDPHPPPEGSQSSVPRGMYAVSPLVAPTVTCKDHELSDLNLSDGCDPSSVYSTSSQTSSMASSYLSDALNLVATPPTSLLNSYGRGGRGQQQKPQVYSAIGSLESLTSPSNKKALAERYHRKYGGFYQNRFAAGMIVPPLGHLTSAAMVAAGDDRGVHGTVSVGTKEGTAAAEITNSGAAGGAGTRGGIVITSTANGTQHRDQPSLLSQEAERLQQPQDYEAEWGRDGMNGTTSGSITEEDNASIPRMLGTKTSHFDVFPGAKANEIPRTTALAVAFNPVSILRKETKKEKKSKRPSSRKSVEIAEGPSNKVVLPKMDEMFRPSCDAYTPRVGRKKLEYKAAEHRAPVQQMSTTMGTISRPNFRDALRRVAMIIHQHIVKIERRFEVGTHDSGDSGLFRTSMREAFNEERYVTPRYKCTVVHLPMGRSGVVYGHRKIEVEYNVPTTGEIYEFGHKLFKAVQLSSECSIVCLIYVEKLMELAKVPLLSNTWRPIFMCGLLLASKVWQDLSSWNVEFASVYPQFSVDAINQLELQFLKCVNWDLYISSSLYAKYYFALRSLLEKQGFRQRYSGMAGVDSVSASDALKVQQRSEMAKEDALAQLSRSM